MDAKWHDPFRLRALCIAALLAIGNPLPAFDLVSTANAAPREGEGEIEVISESELEERDDGLAYRIGVSEPFTGRVISKFYGGQKRSETNYRDGKLHGKSITWYENGRMRMDSNYRNGERDGVWTKWDADGHIQFQRQYRNGSRVF